MGWLVWGFDFCNWFYLCNTIDFAIDFENKFSQITLSPKGAQQQATLA